MTVPPNHPVLLPLRLIAVGGVLACAVLSQANLGPGAYTRLLAWLPLTLADGTVVGSDLVWQTLRSGFVLGIAVGIAHLASLALTLVVDRTGRVGRGLAGVFFAGITFIPIAALSWGFVGWWIGVQHGSIETLLGYTPPPGKDTAALAMARLVWRWAAPCLLLALPLTGWLALHRGRDLAQVRGEVSILGLRARGLPPAWIFYHHILPRLWPIWRRGLEICGVMATAMMLVVEDAVQFHGVGEKMLAAVRAGDVPEMAQALYSIFWIAAAGCAVVGFVERRDPWRAALAAAGQPPLRREGSRGWPAGLALGVLGLAGVWWAGSQVNSHPWAVELIRQMEAALPAVWADLWATLAALALAAGGGLIFGGLRATRVGGIPRSLAVSETLVWLPLLAAWPALAGLAKTYGLLDYAWLALAALGWVVSRLDGTWAAASAARHVESAKALGLGPMWTFFTHVLPGMICPWLMAILDVLPWLWVGRIWITSVVPGTPPQESLGAQLAAVQSQILTRPDDLLPATLLAVLCALCLALPSRILRSLRPD